MTDCLTLLREVMAASAAERRKNIDDALSDPVFVVACILACISGWAIGSVL